MKIPVKAFAQIEPMGSMLAIEFDDPNKTDKRQVLLPDSAINSMPARAGTVRAVGAGGHFDNGTRRDLRREFFERDRVIVGPGTGLVLELEDMSRVELVHADAVLVRLPKTSTPKRLEGPAS